MLHIVKLCVGVTEVEELERWVAGTRKGRDTLDHVTRSFPRRHGEILPGGSLYWVIRGMILCRQPIKSFEVVRGEDSIDRCRMNFAAEIVHVRPVPRRAFQGWRYLEEADAPQDLRKGELPSDMDEAMRRELASLGLI